MPELPIATGFYEDASKPIAAQECTNWLPQIPQTNGYSQAQLIQTPGIDEFADTGNFAARGEHEMKSLAYAVNGNQLHRVDANGTTTALGAISGSGAVSIADNGLQMCIVVPGGDAYIYSVSGGLVVISDSDFTTTLGPSQQVVYKDGYFTHFNNASAASSQAIFFISNLNDGTNYDALDFGTAEVSPDAITAIHVNRNQLYVGGSETIEPFQNIGGVGFPYQRILGGVVQKGIRAKFSAKDFDNSFMFVGGGENELPAVWRLAGAGATKVSTAAIDNILQGLTESELNDVFATVYSENGSFVYYIHLNSRTFGYDAATQLWHERKSKDSFGRLVNWRVNGIMTAYGTTLVTDNQSGKIGRMKNTIYTEYGTSINRAVSTQPFSNQGETLSFSEMEVVCETGTAGPVVEGISRFDVEGFTEEGFDYEPFQIVTEPPKIQREFSDNGGYTFSNQTARSLGRQGDYKIRQVWKREGATNRERVYRFVIDEPIKTSIIKLQANIS